VNKQITNKAETLRIINRFFQQFNYFFFIAIIYIIGKSKPFAPHSPDYLDPSSPIFNDPSSPALNDPQEVLNFILFYQFHKYYTEIFYKGSSINGIQDTILVNFPVYTRNDLIIFVLVPLVRLCSAKRIPVGTSENLVSSGWTAIKCI